jgi:iron(III) transport system ATP-binding protein
VAQFIGHGVFTPAQIVACAHGPCVHTALGELHDMAGCPLPEAYPDGHCDVLLRADDIVHDDASPVKARSSARPSAARSSSTRCAWPAASR